ncbi:hypothetical protein DVS28_a3829 [Euzebya pacifica]|uniref:Uncharacterized protein n=1 Tax=Euzebya pacifica TaxID=1608957 RepID=A0A346Y204_9ACTN|nr:hypothetical protein [Euzebya pacifica]AXV08501.1 hypothetical protein DVS28_a3829 [Euzebya pacifica]
MDDMRLEEISRAYRSQLGEAPPAVTDAAVTAFRAQVRQRAWTGARVVLVLAGAIGLLLELPVILGGAAHTSQDVAVLHTALSIGFLIAAWRPERYARGMVPVALAAAVLLVLPAASDTPAAVDNGVAELSHLPVLAGAAALALGGWMTPARRHRRA